MTGTNLFKILYGVVVYLSYVYIMLDIIVLVTHRSKKIYCYDSYMYTMHFMF